MRVGYLKLRTGLLPQRTLVGNAPTFGEKEPEPEKPKVDKIAEIKRTKSWRRTRWYSGILTLVLTLLPINNMLNQRISRWFGGSGYRNEAVLKGSKTKEVPVPQHLNQGNTNACGPTSLTMGYNAINSNDLGYVSLTRSEVDEVARTADIYTTPEAMAEAARHFGSYAEIYNNSSFEEIVHHIDEGNAVIALLNRTHYVVVSGYGYDSSGNKYLKINDPARTASHNESFEWFDRQWVDFKFANKKTGHNRLIIVLSNTDLPESRYGYNWPSTVASSGANIVNSVATLCKLDMKNLVQPKNIHGLALLLSAMFFLTSIAAPTVNQLSRFNAMLVRASKNATGPADSLKKQVAAVADMAGKKKAPIEI